MADGIEMKLTGIEGVQKALFSYSQQLGDRVTLASLSVGARFVQRTVKQTAPKRTGRLARAIVVKRSKINSPKRGSNKIGVFLAIRRGKGKKDPKDGFYGAWVERGYNVRGKSRGGAGGRGKGRKSLPGKRDIPGQFFMRNSFNRTKIAAVDLIVRAFIAGAEVVKRKVGLR